MYLSAGKGFSFVPTLLLNFFLYKAMENCQLRDSNLAGSIFIFLYVVCCQQVRVGGQGSGILSFIPSCAINLLSNLRRVGFDFY